ncbi:hypothetical protein [Planococcus faecalis]|uniref:hypothetical protein n=1 Tax=Planococcus faecalis TaxID=1598147 RepID=UPI00210CC1F1|nr:hypothetical protein [Planococcus faecalis]
MGHLKKFVHKLFFEKYDQFAKELGYLDWNIASENTFGIYEMEGDTWYHATQLPNKNGLYGMIMRQNHHTLLKYFRLGMKPLKSFENCLKRVDCWKIIGD